MVAVRDFSGLISSACALAKAAANAAIDSLERGIGSPCLQQIESHCANLRTLGAHSMAYRLLGILGHQCFELASCPLVGEKGTTRVSEQRRELRPGVRRAHIDDTDDLEARTRRFRVD